MKRIITLFTVVISSLVLFSSCCSNSNEESRNSDTSTIVTSKVERVRVFSETSSGYSDLYFRLENGFVGVVIHYHDYHMDLKLIEVGDEISYRMNGDYRHFMDSERNDYEVVKVTFKKQDKDNSDSYWN